MIEWSLKHLFPQLRNPKAKEQGSVEPLLIVRYLNWSPPMSRKLWRMFYLAVAVCTAAWLASCGGATSAPISGGTGLGEVVVTVTPAALEVKTGTMQTFTAIVDNTSVEGVQWQVNGIPGGGGDIGTIDKDGNYLAPQYVPNPPNVTITAVANADNTKSGRASATITGTLFPATVIMSPTSAALQIGTQVKLAGGVIGPADTTVVWQVNGVPNGNSTVGTITPGSHNTAVYTAPARVPNPPTVSIKAVSHAEPDKSASCPLTISTQAPTVATVTLTPVVAIAQAEHSFTFTADVINDSDDSVYWEVNGDTGGSQTYGTIASEGSGIGVYTAPVTVPVDSNTVTIKAVSNGQPSRASSALLGISAPPPLGVSVDIVGGTSVQIGSSLSLSATVANANTQDVTWKVNGITGGNAIYGTVVPVVGNTNQATFFAPAQIPAQETVVVSAVPAADPEIAGTLPVTIELAPVTVTIKPSKAQLGITQQAQFTASITNLSNQDATWYVGQGKTFVQGGNSTLGTISPSSNANVVTYTAPAAVPSNPTVVIKAVSEGVPSAYGTATVTISSTPVITVEITPSDPQHVQVNDSVGPYSALVTGTDDQDVLWYVCSDSHTCYQDGNGTLGTMIPYPDDLFKELYLAPPVIPNPATVYVEARSQVDPSAVSNLDSITIQNEQQQPQVKIDPLPYPLLPGGNESVNATVTGIQDRTLNWSLSLPGGGICTAETCGTVSPVQTDNAPTTYTAPQTILQDPYTVNITATSNSVPSAHDTAPIVITQDAEAFIAISPAQPDPIQAGSGNRITFNLQVTNAPPDTIVNWTLGCISEADDGLWCGKAFSNKGDEIGCLFGADGNKHCSSGDKSLNQAGNLAVEYGPPPKLGTVFSPNVCASQPDENGDGFIPLGVVMNAGNCPNGICRAQVCIEVTPGNKVLVRPLP